MVTVIVVIMFILAALSFPAVLREKNRLEIGFFIVSFLISLVVLVLRSLQISLVDPAMKLVELFGDILIK